MKKKKLKKKLKMKMKKKIKNENENFNKKNEEFENKIKNFENEKKKLQIEFEELKLKQINLNNEKNDIKIKLENVQKIQKENEKILNEKRENEIHNNIKIFEDDSKKLKESNENLRNSLKKNYDEIKISTDKIMKMNEKINEKKLKEKSFIIKTTENYIIKKTEVIKKLILKKIDKNFQILIQSKDNNNFKTTETIDMKLIDKFENENGNDNIYNFSYFDKKNQNIKTFKFEVHPKLSNIFFNTMRNFQNAALNLENKNDF